MTDYLTSQFVSDIGICQNEKYLNAWGCGKAGPQPNQPPEVYRRQEDIRTEAAENRWRARAPVERPRHQTRAEGVAGNQERTE